MIPKNNEIYKHFKGNLYKIITLASHSETGEQMVVYQGLYGEFPVYCRPLAMFVSEVDHEKYPDVSQKLRFERVEDLITVDTCVNVSGAVENQQISNNAIMEMNSVSVDKTVDFTENNSTDSEADTTLSDPMAEDISEVDPLILEFLDAETTLEKKNILAALHHRITDEMINTLAVVLDVVIEEGELEDRYQQLKTCLNTIERYEIERK